MLPASVRRRWVAVLAIALALTLAARAAAQAPPAAMPPPSGVPPSATAATPPPALSPAPAGGVDFAAQREAIFDAFYKTGLDISKAYAVKDLAIKKDNMTLLLKQGTVFLMQPIAGEVTGAVFLGDGQAQMTPPNRTQRYMLKKGSGAEILQEPFTEAVFRFCDATDRLILISGKADPSGTAQADSASQLLRDRNAWINGTRIFNTNEDRRLALELQWIENRISGLKGQDYFFADLHTQKHDWLSYLYDPQSIHEHLLTTTATMGAKNRRYLLPWSFWHKSADYMQGGYYAMRPDRDGPRVLRIQHNEMTLDMRTTKTVAWTARLRVEPLIDGIRCLRFDLVNNANRDSRWYEEFRPVRVASVTDEQGATLTFMHVKDQLLVLLPAPARANAPMVIAVKGEAEVIEQLTAESFGLLQEPWYPRDGYMNRSTFDWTVRVPRPFLITGSGTVVREFEDKEKGQNGLQTRCESPVDFPWVIFGRFQKTADKYESEESKKTIPLTIHSFPTMTMSITDEETLNYLGLDGPVTLNLSAPAKRVEAMLDEGKQVIKLYEKIYGPYPYDELHIAQMAPQLTFGQSPQGFVQLWGGAFMTQAQLAANEMTGPGPTDLVHGLYAHEIAHQWWGNQVSWGSGDDEWLSESFAEYASGIFVKELQGVKRFIQQLDRWKMEAKQADKEGPIAAANDLGGPNALDRRTQLLYAKGPYVLHMLRVQLDDEMYVKIMKSLQNNYKNQKITSEIFVREVNRVSGKDYTSFFDQWFWGTGIPTFRYSWRTEKQPDGKFLIVVHVSQDDKANLKKVMMPVHIHFKDKTVPQYKPIVEAEQDLKILSPIDPKDVTLDDDRTLLADIFKAG
jgi:hypothetical protein